MKKYIRRMIAAIMVVATLFGVVATVSAASFTDVDEKAWYYEAVNFVANKGLMSGTGNGKFEPNTTMTRAMAVQILYALAGSPNPTGNMPFKDVPTNTWYYNAVKWAYNNNVVSGTSSSTFNPDTKITREQFATMLYQYDKTFLPYFNIARNITNRYPKININVNNHQYTGLGVSTYADYNKVSSWALPAIHWIISKSSPYTAQLKTSKRHVHIKGQNNYSSIMQGKEQHNSLYLCPKDTLSRAECAQLLKNYYQINFLSPKNFSEEGIEDNYINKEWREFNFQYSQNGYKTGTSYVVPAPYFDLHPEEYLFD